MPQTGLVAPQRKLNILLPVLDHPSNGQRISPDSYHSKDDIGLPLTPKNVDPMNGVRGHKRKKKAGG